MVESSADYLAVTGSFSDSTLFFPFIKILWPFKNHRIKKNAACSSEKNHTTVPVH